MSKRISISDLAIKRGATYRGTYEAALRGDFGRVERVGRRLYVRLEAAADHLAGPGNTTTAAEPPEAA